VYGKPGQPGGCGRESWLAVYDAASDQWLTQVVQITDAAGTLVTICDGTGLTGGFTRFVRTCVLSDQSLAAAVGARWQLFFGPGEEVCQALGANPDGTVSQWRRIAGAVGPGLPNTDPVHADIWGFHLDLGGRNGWIVGDGGVFTDFPGPGADWSSRHWRLQSDSLRTHTATRLAVLRAVPTERSRLVYSTGDNDYWWRDAAPHAFPVASWESPSAVGDANWCTGDVGSPAIAVVCGHNVHQVALTTFDQPAPPGSAFTPNSALNLTLGDGYDGPYFFHVIQTLAHQQGPALLDVLMLVNGPLRCLNSTGTLINATNAGGGPLLIRNRSFASGPDANATKLATWTLESDSLPNGVYGVAASGGSPDPVLYAWSNAGGALSLYQRATPPDAWNPVAVGGLVAGAVWAAPVFVNPFDASEVLVLTSDGVLQSHDGGGTFAPEDGLNHLIGGPAAGTVVEMAFNRDNPRELAVATNSGGYFRDSSGAWHNLTPLLPKPATGTITAVAIDAEAVYFSSGGRGVFRVRGHRRA